MLDEFITRHRDEIIRRCRAKVIARTVPSPTESEINHGVPMFLDQLVATLVSGGDELNNEIARSAILHGQDLLQQGFTVSQVVHDYGDICQSVTELALEMQAPISTDDFRTLNRCLDDAIASAVTEFGRHRSEFDQEDHAARSAERFGFLVHELRNLLNTAVLAFEVLQTGNVGVAGSTGHVLRRSLTGARELVGRSLAQVRVTQDARHWEQFPVSAFLAEVAATAALEAGKRGVTFNVLPVTDDVVVEGDREVLFAVVGNILQNAFKFTGQGTTVTLRVGASARRVLIEVEDECGGLPNNSGDALFRPFEQRGADRSGLGLGLAFSRVGVEANRGRIYARSLPGKGCVFTVDLPRLVPASVPALAADQSASDARAAT